MSLNHPTITLAELQKLNSTTTQTVQPANFIDFHSKPGSVPYKLVWLTMPSGETRLYRLVPDSKPT
jgi:hypothetical protein